VKHLAIVAILGTVAVAAVLPAAATAGVPSDVDRADAKRFARNYWVQNYGARPDCWGVNLRFHPSWKMPSGALALVANRTCTIHFNRSISWGNLGPGYGWGDDWWRFCSTMIHEYGHLPGMPFDGTAGPLHSRNANNVMAGSETLSVQSWWWPHHPACRYDGDDAGSPWINE
jgi:hypothetical protein